MDRRRFISSACAVPPAGKAAGYRTTGAGENSEGAVDLLDYMRARRITEIGTGLQRALEDTAPGSGSRLSGRSCIRIPPGAYRASEGGNFTMPNTDEWDVTIVADGAVITHTGTEPFLSCRRTGILGSYSRLTWHGGRMRATAALREKGLFQLVNMNMSTFTGVTFGGIENGYCFHLINTDALWSENNRFLHCDFYNCRRFISFSVAGGKASFARTRVFDIFGDDGGCADYWIFCPYSAPVPSGVYDSYFCMIAGNMGVRAGEHATAVIHASGSMGGTLIECINVEAAAPLRGAYGVWLDSFGRELSGAPPTVGEVSARNLQDRIYAVRSRDIRARGSAGW